MTPTELRALFPICQERAYLNNAGVAPTSTPVKAAMNRWVDDLITHGLGNEPEWEEVAEQTRERAARLLDVTPGEIAFVRNTSHGLGLVAEGIDWRAGDEVVVCREVEYPSNVYPWLHLAGRGVVTREARPVRDGVVAEAIAEQITERTRLVSVSAVQYASGHRTDLRALGELCRDRGVLLNVDGIQQVGAFPLHPRELGVHFLSADSHKWLLGLCGIGLMFVDRDVVSELRPSLVGWKSTTDAFNFDRVHFELRDDAAKVEEGTPAYALIYGFGAALDQLLQIGLTNVAQHICELHTRIETGAAELGYTSGPDIAERAGILMLTGPGDPEEVVQRCDAAGVTISLRRGRLRVSPHAYNDMGDVERLLEALDVGAH